MLLRRLKNVRRYARYPGRMKVLIVSTCLKYHRFDVLGTHTVRSQLVCIFRIPQVRIALKRKNNCLLAKVTVFAKSLLGCIV